MKLDCLKRFDMLGLTETFLQKDEVERKGLSSSRERNRKGKNDGEVEG